MAKLKCDKEETTLTRLRKWLNWVCVLTNKNTKVEKILSMNVDDVDVWLLKVSYRRQAGDGFFDLREKNVTMDVSWCTLVSLLPPETEWREEMFRCGPCWTEICRDSRKGHWCPTCSDCPLPEGLWHQHVATPLLRTPPTTALLLPPSTGRKSSPHTEKLVQPGLGAA